MAQAAQASTGNRVGHYQLLGQIGAGGMGRVFKAFDTSLERTVALKFLNPDPGGSQAERERLLREARAASVLDHRNIAAIHAVEQTEDGQLFIVMAYCEGETLGALLRRGPLQPVRAIALACQVARGLEHAHAHGIIHRDIKPSNVILAPDGVARIVDFGLARRFTPLETQSGMVGGTLSYMPPEQVAGAPADARSDIWSLGVMLYEMISGRLPFAQPSAGSTVLAILHAAPAPLESVPEGLELVIYRALAKTPGARYQSCAELLRDLEALAPNDSQPTAVLEPRDLHRRVRQAARALAPRDSRRLALSAAAALLATLLIGFLGLAASGWRSGWFSRSEGPPAKAQSAAYETYLAGINYLQRYDRPENLNKAIAELEMTVRSDPGFALAYAALGEAYWDKYRLEQDPRWIEQAAAYCKRAAELNDRLPSVYITLGRIHNGSGEHELALQELQRALELDASNPDALLALADVYASVGRNREAEEQYKKAVVLRPDSWEGYQRLGFFYFRQRRFPEAVDQFRRVVELAPDSATGRANLAIMLRNSGQEAEAEAELKKSISLLPTYTAYANLGTLYYTQKRYAESVAMTEKALQLNDKNYLVWANLAVGYDWLGQFDKVKEANQRTLALLLQAANRSPRDASIQAELGLVSAKLGQAEKARRSAEAAIALSPDDPAVLATVGLTYFNLGDRPKAVQFIRRSLKKGLKLEEFQNDPDGRRLLRDEVVRRGITHSGPSRPEAGITP